jgi:hypothetical protein
MRMGAWVDPFTGKLAPGRERHRIYLQSPEWHALRAEALERDGHCCRVCASREPLNVHHRRYPRPWEVDCLDNLTTLCRSCHQAAHHRIWWFTLVRHGTWLCLWFTLLVAAAWIYGRN